MTSPTSNSPSLRSNLWKIYFYRFLSDFWLIAPILVPFYEKNGLSATQVFVVQAIYSVSVLVFEIPSGYLSDVIGRKSTLVLGSLFLPIGLFIYAFSYGFFGFAIAEFIMGIAAALRSGTDSALIYDSLIQMERESDYKKFEGTAEAFHQVAHAGSAILGGLFALSSLRLPFYMNIASGLLLFPLAVSFVEPERKKLEAGNPLLEILSISKRALTDPQIKWIIMFSALLIGAGITGVWSYYMYYIELGLSVGLFGVISAIFGLCSALGASQAHYLEGKLGPRKSIYLPLMISLTFILLGLIKSNSLIPLILMNAFIWGFSGPVLRDHINKLIESDIRATVLSVGSMIGSLAFVIISPIFGRIVDFLSLEVAHAMLGAFFLIFGLYCITMLHRNKVI
jgi:MFS family permease